MSIPERADRPAAAQPPIGEDLACTLATEELAPRGRATANLFDRAERRRRLPDGAELEFGGDDDAARALLEFVLLERRCCAQLTYELHFAPDHSTIVLRLRGRGRQSEAIRAWAAVGE